MKQPVIVRILPSDLVRGEARSSCGCPIARAFCRAYPDAQLDGIAPDMAIIDFRDGLGQQRFNLTAEARAFIRAFDDGLTVQPGAIHLFNL